MTYLATIKFPYIPSQRMFTSLSEAERWIDQNNNNLIYPSIIETFDDIGNKTDGFFYTEPKK